VYGWEGQWGSLGYFGKIVEAKAAMSGVEWVRRWTGGGIVDHRNDWTYSMIVPAGTVLAKLRGAESYEWIHRCLAMALAKEAVEATVCGEELSNGSACCFENPVGYDLVTGGQCKIAGAGQRRSRRGLLHQGSVALSGDLEQRQRRAENVAGEMAEQWQRVEIHPDRGEIERLMRDKYANEKWQEKR
jgi:lipoate-protein ligase A